MKPNDYTLNFTPQEEECQEKFNSPDFFKELQKAHKRNKKALYKMAYNGNDIEKAKRIINCSNFLTYELINQELLRLHRINLCRERLCLNCQLVNSRNLIRELFWIVPRLQVKQDVSLEFITLTIPNSAGKDLKSNIQHMTKRQTAFFRHYGIKDYFRSIEVTYNKDTDTFHPHLHMLALVPKDTGFPFYKAKKGQAGANELQEKWYEWYGIPNEHGFCMATTYTITNTKSIFEVCKYVSKVEDLENEKILKVLAEQLKGLRLKTPCGQFKTLAKSYKLECMSLKLQELKELENAERQLIYMLYNPTAHEYEIRSVVHTKRVQTIGKIFGCSDESGASVV